MSLSVVIPTFNAANHVAKLVEGLSQLGDMAGRDVEVVFVDDGSSDKTVSQLQSIASTTPIALRVISLHKNIGQTQATAVGLSLARFDTVVAMDDDLQHPVSAIPRLMNRLDADGLDFVVGGLLEQQQSFFRKITSRFIHSVARRSLKTPPNHRFSSFMVFRRDFLQNADLLNRPRVDVHWMYQLTSRYGFEFVEHSPSLRGHSNYRFKGLLSVARPFVWYLLSGLIRPLVYIGGLVSVFSVVLALYYFWLYLTARELLPGFATLTLIGLANLAIVSLFLATTIRLLLTALSFAQFGPIKRVTWSEFEN